jgi:hypothetical protein
VATSSRYPNGPKTESAPAVWFGIRVPADRAKALQAAFLAAHKDPGYLAEAEKLKLDVSPIGGDQIQELINRIAETPKDQLKSLEKVILGGG